LVGRIEVRIPDGNAFILFQKQTDNLALVKHSEELTVMLTRVSIILALIALSTPGGIFRSSAAQSPSPITNETVKAPASLAEPSGVPSSQQASSFTPGFEGRAMAHVRQLAGYGVHDAGSSREREAAQYISTEMKKTGLSVTTEPFAFNAFTLKDAQLIAGTIKAKIVKLAFDPYGATSPIAGNLVIVTAKAPRDVLALDLNGKIVAVADDNSFKVVSIFKEPKAVLSVAPSDFDRLKEAAATSAMIEFSGQEFGGKSQNIIGTLPGKPGANEILITAHYDSVRGPGANDNASGVAALLELARYFAAAQTPGSITLSFVAFGSEEAGLLGSKAYLQKHSDELKSCKFVFNIDEIGGNGGLHVDTGDGVKGVPEEVENQLPVQLIDKATNDIKDPEQRWRLLSSGEQSLWMSSNVPMWLRSELRDTSTMLGYRIEERNRTGSDHRVFIQAGVVATHIGSDGGAEEHSPADVPEAVDAKNLEKAALIVLNVVENMMFEGTK
jgi:hypothetical protein